MVVYGIVNGNYKVRFLITIRFFEKKEPRIYCFAIAVREFRKKFLGLLLQRRLKYRYFLRVNMSLLCGLSLVCHDPQAAKKALLCINDTSILITLSTRYKMSGYSWVCVCKPRQGNSSRWLGLFMLNRLAAEVKNPCGDSQSAGNSQYCGPSLGCEAP